MLHHLTRFFTDRTALAIGAVFALVGIAYGTWAAFIPMVKTKFSLDEAQLGLLLLMLPFGAGVMNPICVKVLRQQGTIKTTLISLFLLGFILVLPINMPTVWLAAVTLFGFGMVFSATNISMNTFASHWEVQEGKVIISTCHGLWSGGAMIGAGATGTALAWGLEPQFYVFWVAAALALSTPWLRKPLLALKEMPPETKAVRTSQAFFRPNQALWGLIVMGLCVNLGEGTMADWAAVYVKEEMGAPASVAGWSYSVYAFFMMSGRLAGDGLITRFGNKNMLTACGTMLALGYAVAVVAPDIPVLFIGYALIGLGVSLGSPILYAASSKVPGLPKGAGLAVYNTYSMVAFLGGPVFIGFLAKAIGLQMAFGVVALCAVGWALKAANWKG